MIRPFIEALSTVCFLFVLVGQLTLKRRSDGFGSDLGALR